MDRQQQMEWVLGTDPTVFEALITHLMSSDNDRRSQAESIFNLCRAHYPDAVALKLTHILHSPLPDLLRTMATVLLRRHLSSSDGGVGDGGLSQLSATTKESLKSLLLQAVEQEECKSLSKKLCDVVSEIAIALLPENEWPELLPYLFQSFTSGFPRIKESALLIFARLAQSIGDTFLPHLATLHSVLLSSLSPSFSPNVRIAALGASINLVQWLPCAVERDSFQDLLPAMIRALTESLTSVNETIAQEAVELLVDLADTDPEFLRGQLPDMVGSLLLIAESDSLAESTRHLAVEFLATLAVALDRAPGMILKKPQYIGRLVTVLMNMLLDISDNDIENNDAGETGNYVGQKCLGRLSIALGGNTIFPAVSELLPAFFASPDWQKHHAALIALAQIAGGCSSIMIKNLEQVVPMVLNSFQHPHPRVKWAAIIAIGQLSIDLGPDLQVQYHQRVLPVLASAIDDFQNPQVQAQAASAVLSFTKNCTADILTSYLDGLVSKLLVLLQNGKQMVQEGALTALASVADSSQEQFKNYYDAVIPYLKAILLNAMDNSNRMLQAKSMECVSSVGMAVGKDKFRDDAKQVMEVLASLQGSQMDSDDPIACYMLHAWKRLCKCLGPDFLPYMNIVMPPLLQAAQLKADVNITSADSEDIYDSDDDSIDIIIINNKRIGIRTSVLEEKATACYIICCYADELKEGFYPWIDQVVPTLVPLLKFYFHEQVRRAAVAAMPELLQSAKLAVEKGVAQGRDESYVKQLSDYIIPALTEALYVEPEEKICSSMLDTLNQCMQLSGHFLDEGQVRSIVETIGHVVTASTSRKMERAERMRAEDFDAEEGEFLREDNEQEVEISVQRWRVDPAGGNGEFEPEGRGGCSKRSFLWRFSRRAGGNGANAAGERDLHAEEVPRRPMRCENMSRGGGVYRKEERATTCAEKIVNVAMSSIEGEQVDDNSFGGQDVTSYFRTLAEVAVPQRMPWEEEEGGVLISNPRNCGKR
ncbi:hypothetical protein KSP40_PGU006553 [Platanthera guangdongensis]|uniref:TOG domain-containing protein n=1 Tax=Platanthera guangdongensis TaxID=2320717 RepID=A0ABR2ME53_9ASPA